MKALDSLFSKKKQVRYDPVIRKDCRGCYLQPDLGKKDCLRCICNDINNNSGCERIEFDAGVRIELSDCCISLINDISVSFGDRQFGRNGRRCRECPLGNRLNDDLWDDLTEENIVNIMDRLKLTYIDCDHCEECASYAYDAFQRMKEDYTSLSKDASHLADRIVGA